MWPENGKMADMASKGEIKWMWPEEGNTKDVARRGEYNWYGQKRET